VNIRWHGHSAFTLRSRDAAVLVDPFDQRARPESTRIRFDYPEIPPQAVDLVLISHEHFDHNGAGVASGEPQVIRSTAGRKDSVVGEVVAVASEHDAEAGTRRGPNTVFVFSLDDIRICHMGDFGQSALRPEQREAIGTVDVLFIPVGGGPTIDGTHAATVVRDLQPRWTVPMHYRTPFADFVESPDAFLAQFESVVQVHTASLDLEDAPQEGALHVLLLSPPAAPEGLQPEPMNQPTIAP
jgi:L-ascorbate metabolism protein UlaG (beta-lactamase superfamily)